MIEYTVKFDCFGTKYWYLNGQLHREDGPAIEYADGAKYWYLNGKRHREDGPAVEYSNGSKGWYLNGKRHREDGPAEEKASGSKYWFLNGKRHREDGPAEEWADGSKSWFLNGKRHREDGPAEEWADGSKGWYLNDKRHREDGPAIEWADGSKYWFLNDKYHREDGPAIEWADGSKYWFLNGKYHTEEEFNKKMNLVKELTVEKSSNDKKWEYVDSVLTKLRQNSDIHRKACEDMHIDYNSPLSEPFSEVELALITTLEQWVDDKNGNIMWFVYDCNYGREAMEAGCEGNRRKIETVDDLRWLIELNC